VKGIYQADGLMSQLGSSAVGVLAVWIAVFFLYGVSIWVGNAFNN
jgi:hypothetical protein